MLPCDWLRTLFVVLDMDTQARKNSTCTKQKANASQLSQKRGKFKNQNKLGKAKDFRELSREIEGRNFTSKCKQTFTENFETAIC